ncbi:hypothetical protein DFH09DRAFT_1101485 [Mycena vulgaris]|nr:hypothetical protein DFH09DRAFT_1101485 [Mycena vulgaris]
MSAAAHGTIVCVGRGELVGTGASPVRDVLRAFISHGTSTASEPLPEYMTPPFSRCCGTPGQYLGIDRTTVLAKSRHSHFGSWVILSLEGLWGPNRQSCGNSGTGKAPEHFFQHIFMIMIGEIDTVVVEARMGA